MSPPVGSSRRSVIMCSWNLTIVSLPPWTVVAGRGREGDWPGTGFLQGRLSLKFG